MHLQRECENYLLRLLVCHIHGCKVDLRYITPSLQTLHLVHQHHHLCPEDVTGAMCTVKTVGSPWSTTHATQHLDPSLLHTLQLQLQLQLLVMQVPHLHE
jgi:hypothetical protein